MNDKPLNDSGAPVPCIPWFGAPKSPHVCPVCGGKGTVPPGFYDENGGYSTAIKTRETCRACGGRGIVEC